MWPFLAAPVSTSLIQVFHGQPLFLPTSLEGLSCDVQGFVADGIRPVTLEDLSLAAVDECILVTVVLHVSAL